MHFSGLHCGTPEGDTMKNHKFRVEGVRAAAPILKFCQIHLTGCPHQGAHRAHLKFGPHAYEWKWHFWLALGDPVKPQNCKPGFPWTAYLASVSLFVKTRLSHAMLSTSKHVKSKSKNKSPRCFKGQWKITWMSPVKLSGMAVPRPSDTTPPTTNPLGSNPSLKQS